MLDRLATGAFGEMDESRAVAPGGWDVPSDSGLDPHRPHDRVDARYLVRVPDEATWASVGHALANPSVR
jgi:hypothetical protein